jgi:hypothetical protein
MERMNNQNIPQCLLLNMPAIPTFGIYDRFEYLLMQPIHIIKSQKMMPDNLPPFIFQQIKVLSQKYKQIIPEFYHVTLNANNIYINSNERIIESNYTRINLVAHPYIFNNPNISQTSKTHINCAIFKDNDELDTIRESNESTNVKINPECDAISPTLNRDIKIEINQRDKKIYLEPNNCSFLINLNCQIINFYCIVLGTHNNIVTKCFIGNYVIIPNVLSSHILKMITENLLYPKDNETKFLSLIMGQLIYNDSLMSLLYNFLDKLFNNPSDRKSINDIKDIFVKAFKIIYEFDTSNVSQKDHEQDLNNIGNYYYEHIKKFINHIYPGSSSVEQFSEKILLCSLKNKYIIEIIIKYIDFHLSNINNIICSYFDYYNQEKINIQKIKEDASHIHKNKNWPALQETFCKQLKINKKDFDRAIGLYINKNRKKITNHNIELFQRLCNNLLENQNIDNNILEQIDEPIREYFYYHIWVYKGSLKGIHKDFGKHSFLCSNKIKSIYHCHSDERYNFCEKMKLILFEADAPYKEQ